MKRNSGIAVAIGLVLIVVVVAVGTQNAEGDSPSSKLYQVVYNAADLPVWRSNGKQAAEFAPEVLIEYIRSTVDSKSWKSGAEIRPFKSNASLVIAQTQSNHEKIADVLQSFRVNDPREVEERVGRSRWHSSAATL